MSFENVQDDAAQFKAELFQAVPEKCLPCIPMRVLVGQMAHLAVLDQCDISDKLHDFAGFSAKCQIGKTTEGVCGTERPVCNHPEMPEYCTPALSELASDLISTDD